MPIVFSFLMFIGANGVKVAADHYNAAPRKVSREMAEMKREEIKAFKHMLKTSDRMGRE